MVFPVVLWLYMLWWESWKRGVDPCNEIIENPHPNPIMKNRETLYIDMFDNPKPNLPFYSQIPVPRTPIPFSQLMKRQILVPNLPLPYSNEYCSDSLRVAILLLTVIQQCLLFPWVIKQMIIIQFLSYWSWKSWFGNLNFLQAGNNCIGCTALVSIIAQKICDSF